MIDIDPQEFVDGIERHKNQGDQKRASKARKIGNRIAKRVLAHARNNNPTFLAKGGLLGLRATSHDADVYQAAADRLEEEGISIAVRYDRVWKGLDATPANTDIISITAIHGRVIADAEQKLVSPAGRYVFPPVNTEEE